MTSQQPHQDSQRLQRRITSKASDYAQLGRQQKAIETLEAGLEDYPDNFYFLTQLGHLYRRAGDLFKAQMCMERGMAIKPTDIRTISALGAVCAERGVYSQAEKVLLQGRQINPHDKFVVTALADVFVQQGKYREAAEVLEASDGLKYGNKFVIASLGNVYALLDRHADARQVLETGYRLHARDPYIINALGNVSAEQGDYDRAEDVLRRGYKADPNNKFIIASLGSVLAQQKKFDEAEKVLLAGNRVHPFDTVIANSLGSVYAQLGWFGKAEQFLRDALARDPGNVALLTTLGHAYLREKDYARFDELIEATEGLQSRDTSYLYLVAKGAFVQGKHEAARVAAAALLEERGFEPQAGSLYLACCDHALTASSRQADPVIEQMKEMLGPVGFKDMRLQAAELLHKPELLDRLDPRFAPKLPRFMVVRHRDTPISSDTIAAATSFAVMMVMTFGLPQSVLHVLSAATSDDSGAMGVSGAVLATVLTLCRRVTPVKTG